MSSGAQEVPEQDVNSGDEIGSLSRNNGLKRNVFCLKSMVYSGSIPSLPRTKN